MGYNKKRNKQVRGRGGGNRGRSSTTTAASSHVPVVRPLVINEETRWKPRSLTVNNPENDSSEQEQDARLVLLLLNKLTPQNFDKVVSSFLSQTRIHQSNEKMENTIEAIIERASLDMRYAQVHAKLCQRLASDLSKEKDESCISFREALLNYCRQHVSPPTDTCSAADDPHEDMFEHPEERQARLLLARHRYVGSNSLLGELCNNGFFDLAEILSLVEMLLNQQAEFSTSSEHVVPSELVLEGLCVLLDTCGKALDETAIETPEMQRCWKTLGKMVCYEENKTSRQLSFRMKCMILDLLELREAGWNPTRYSSQQRKELIAKPLECKVDSEAGDGGRRKKRGGKKRVKTVRFASK